ncbi:hypothetical protein [Aeromonas media]|uniref:hypothetical protein n=1 Tax=Aeromonas media TaxID=651 RepID=UPI003D03E447
MRSANPVARGRPASPSSASLPAILENLKGNARRFGLAETYTQEVLASILRKAM